MTATDPTASVIEHAPPGPVALTVEQREEVRASVKRYRLRAVTDKYAARENALAMVRAALEGK